MRTDTAVVDCVARTARIGSQTYRLTPSLDPTDGFDVSTNDEPRVRLGVVRWLGLAGVDVVDYRGSDKRLIQELRDVGSLWFNGCSAPGNCEAHGTLRAAVTVDARGELPTDEQHAWQWRDALPTSTPGAIACSVCGATVEDVEAAGWRDHLPKCTGAR